MRKFLCFLLCFVLICGMQVVSLADTENGSTKANATRVENGATEANNFDKSTAESDVIQSRTNDVIATNENIATQQSSDDVLLTLDQYANTYTWH